MMTYFGESLETALAMQSVKCNLDSHESVRGKNLGEIRFEQQDVLGACRDNPGPSMQNCHVLVAMKALRHMIISHWYPNPNMA